MKRFLAVVATLTGVGFLVAGVTLLSVPAALILSGVLLAAFGLLVVDIPDRRSPEE